MHVFQWDRSACRHLYSVCNLYCDIGVAQTVEWGLTVHHVLCVVNCCTACPPPTPPPREQNKSREHRSQAGQSRLYEWRQKTAASWKKMLLLPLCTVGPPPPTTHPPTASYLHSLAVSLLLAMTCPSSLHSPTAASLPPSYWPFSSPPPPSHLSSSSPLPAVCSATVFPAARWLLWRSSLQGLVLPSSWAFKSCDLSLIGHILHISFVYGLILFLPHTDLHWWILPSVTGLNCRQEVFPHHKK